MAPLPDRLHGSTLEALSRLAARRPLPAPDSASAQRVEPSLPAGARIHIVLKDADSWILSKFADRLEQQLRARHVEVSVGWNPDPSAAVNHFIIYAAYERRGPTLETVMVTHVADEDELLTVKRQMSGVEMAICMSFDTVHRLAHFGIPRERLCFVNPAHDQAISPRPLLIGLTNRLYADGRKREGMLVDVCGAISPRDFRFAIMGAGWELIVLQLRSAGFHVEYFEQFEEETYRQLIPSLDYFLHLGRDEGAMGWLDALAGGVATIVTPQGYHLDVPGGITHAFNDVNDLKRVFAEIAAVRRRRVEGVSNLTWSEYARNHLLIWDYLLRHHQGRAVPESLVRQLEELCVALTEPEVSEATAHATVRVCYEPCGPVGVAEGGSGTESNSTRRMRRRFPDRRVDFNVIYLASESRGPDWQSLFWRAWRSGAATVWSHGRTDLTAGVSEASDPQRHYLRQGLELADYVFYRSDFARQRAAGVLGERPDRWEVLHDPVDTDHFVPRDLRSHRGPGFSILLAGNAHTVEQLRLAVRALIVARASLGDVTLLVPGSVACATDLPDCRRAVASLLAETGATDFVRWLEPYRRDNAPDMLAQADVLLHMALDDPCPRVVPESLACGVPIVYARSGAVEELVGEVAGLGVELPAEGTSESVAARIADAAAALLSAQERRREAARQRALDQFGIDHWLARHEAVFESLTAAAPVRARTTAANGPVRLRRLHPDRITFGDRFNAQPDGRSALAVEAEAASAATCIVFNGRPLPTSHGGAGLLTAVVPSSSIEPGLLSVHLVDGVTESDRLDFHVDMPVDDRGRR